MLSVQPVNNANFVARDTGITVRFSEPLIPGTITDKNFLLSVRATGQSVSGSVSVSQDREGATFQPDQELLRNTGYRVRVLPDVTGISLEPLPEEFRSVFTTAVSSDTPPPSPPPPSTGSFTSVGPMNTGRSSHTSTLLGSGKVLVAGGFSNSTTLTATAEVFDPDTGKFTNTGGSLHTARAYHTATRLRDGTVLILGGLAGSSFTETASAEIYDPVTDRFSALPMGMNHARAFHTATLLDDGRVLIVGGTVPTQSGSYSSKTAEIYEPNLGGIPTFKELPDMAVYRAGHTATKLPDGRVLIMGGNSTDTRIEEFDPNTDKFTVLSGQLHVPRRGHTATLLSDGNVLVMGGGQRSAEIYFVNKDYFLWTPDYPLYDRSYHTANLTTNGLVLFTGGSHGQYGSATDPLFFSQTTEFYDPSTGAFIANGPLLANPTARHRSTVLKDGSILVTGGSNIDASKNDYSSAQVFKAD